MVNRVGSAMSRCQPLHLNQQTPSPRTDLLNREGPRFDATAATSGIAYALRCSRCIHSLILRSLATEAFYYPLGAGSSRLGLSNSV
jgi:hypothetical protein